MIKEQIENSPIYKELVKFSNSQRGIAFDKCSALIEENLGVKLIRHPYTRAKELDTNNILLSYQNNFGGLDGPTIEIMEFKPI